MKYLLNKFSFMTNKKNIKDRLNQGTAMIVAIIIMSILMIFTFSLTLVAYTLYASQNKNIASMRCSEAANTLSLALEDELTYDKEVAKDPVYESYLYNYLRYNLCQASTWPYYNPNEDGHTEEYAFRYFELKYNSKKPSYDEDGNAIENANHTPKYLDGIEGMPGRTEVCIYWMLPDGVETTDNLSGSGESRQGVRLFIEITSESANQSYTVKSEYVLNVLYYDMLNLPSSTKQTYLVSETLYNDDAVNPQHIDPENINSNEEWKWKKVVGD